MDPITTDANKFFGLDPALPAVLIIGGSQGSEKINESIIDILPELVEKYTVIHQTGKSKSRKRFRIWRSSFSKTAKKKSLQTDSVFKYSLSSHGRRRRFGRHFSRRFGDIRNRSFGKNLPSSFRFRKKSVTTRHQTLSPTPRRARVPSSKRPISRRMF